MGSVQALAGGEDDGLKMRAARFWRQLVEQVIVERFGPPFELVSGESTVAVTKGLGLGEVVFHQGDDQQATTRCGQTQYRGRRTRSMCAHPSADQLCSPIPIVVPVEVGRSLALTAA